MITIAQCVYPDEEGHKDIDRTAEGEEIVLVYSINSAMMDEIHSLLGLDENDAESNDDTVMTTRETFDRIRNLLSIPEQTPFALQVDKNAMDPDLFDAMKRVLDIFALYAGLILGHGELPLPDVIDANLKPFMRAYQTFLHDRTLAAMTAAIDALPHDKLKEIALRSLENDTSLQIAERDRIAAELANL